MNFKETLGKKLLFIDGAMGTMIGKTDVLPEVLNITAPERIKKIHTAYLDAGADIITTNTFGANRFKMKDYTVEDIIKAALKNARECVDKYGKLVTLDIGPLGALLAPMGNVSFDEAYDVFAQIVKCAKYGADLISIETMTDTYELKAAVLAAKENSDLPVIATVSLDRDGNLLCGADILSVVSLLEGLGVDALGFNCGFGPAQLEEFFGELKKYASIPIALVPNGGLPRFENGETVYDLTAGEFSDIMAEFACGGAHLLGGCCGTTPEHIRLTKEKCKDIKITPPESKNITSVSSFGKGVLIGEKPVIIGERINPTGKKKLKEALRNNEIDYVLKEGINQYEAGAHILDVNVGLPEIDEASMMSKCVFELQSILSLPLQLDSSSPEVLEKAMRIYNGKPLINSVNGKKVSMEAVFPLVKKYGGVVVGLTLDERGIPDTAEGRLLIAEKIINTAKEYGIDKKNIIIDPLTLTVSSDAQAAKETLRAVKLVSEKLGVSTILGVSNISFGLPQREKINASFLLLALQSGLSAAIMNPLSSAMMCSVDSYNLLYAKDADFKEYIKKYADVPKEEKKAPSELSLRDLIVLGLKSESYAKTAEMLKSIEPMTIINEHIISALDEVGRGFEAKKIFLPSLLTSAETAQNAFSAIQDNSPKKEETGEKILLATVYGDIHDIGKNIVKLLLKNYGYRIIDLGRDVPPQKIVEAVKAENIKLVGLSALMTTTVIYMEETIKALRAAGLSAKVMVGGAVLTQEYSDMIGADFYAKDALASVTYAKNVFGA